MSDAERILWEPPLEFLEKLRELDTDYVVLREVTRNIMHDLFDELAKQTIHSLEEKQDIAEEIRSRLRRVCLAIECPTCHKPSMIRAQVAGNSKGGIFQFQHAKTNHGGTTQFPPNLNIIDAPLDKRLRSKKSAKPDQQGTEAVFYDI